MKNQYRITILALLWLLAFLAVPITTLFAEEKESDIKLITFDRKEKRVRQSVSEAFQDIIYSPTILSQEGYMEIDLEPNEIITKENCFVAIYFGKQGFKTEFTAYPFEVVDGKRVIVTEASVVMGVRLVLEGVVKELNYRYEVANGRYAGLSEFEMLKSKEMKMIRIRQTVSVNARHR